jgi:putative hydrolase of the HAD superfamily
VIEAVVSDFGGVLTVPLIESFARVNAELGIPPEALGKAMAEYARDRGEPPLFALERGHLAADEFVTGLGASLNRVLGRDVDIANFGPRLMALTEPNQPLLDHYRTLRDDHGLRLAILTNNIREWQPHWREPMRIDDLFELVVDSGFEGFRKPEPEIYAIVLERLGLPGEACVFVDDLEVNLAPARAAGMHTVHFRDTAQVIAELDALVL